MGQIQNFMMKAIEVKTVFAGAIICILAFTSTQAAEVTPAQARVIARDAYIFTYPLALQYHTMYVQAIDSFWIESNRWPRSIRNGRIKNPSHPCSKAT